MTYRLTSRAYRDLEQLLSFLAEQDPHAAEVLLRRLEHTLTFIPCAPRIGRVGTRPKTRELPVPHTPVLVVYRVTEHIEVLTIFHTRIQTYDGDEHRPSPLVELLICAPL